MEPRTTHRTTHRVQVPGYWIADYEERVPAAPADEVIVLLHGYSESGSVIFRKLEPFLPAEAHVIAPNGLFPIPQRTDDGYRMGYSWYFYNPKTDEYVMDMDSAIRFVSGLLDLRKLSHLPLRIIGFSQGGYLAPFLGLRQPRTRQVIGIGCEFVADEIAETGKKISFRLDQIHGDEDEVVSLVSVRQSHEKLKERGAEGELAIFPGVGHRISPEVREKVKAWITRV